MNYIRTTESQFSTICIENSTSKFYWNSMFKPLKSTCHQEKCLAWAGGPQARRYGNLLSPAGTDHYFLWEVRLHFWLKSEHDSLSQRTEIKASLYFSVWRGHILPVVLLYPYSIVVPEVSIHRISNSAKICFEWWVAKLPPHMSRLGFSLSSRRDNNLNSNVLLHISSSCFVWNSDCSMGLENKHCILSEF